MKIKQEVTFLITISFLIWFGLDGRCQSRPVLMNQPLDISPDFRDFSNTLFVADSLTAFDPSTGTGTLKWARNSIYGAQAFDNTMYGYRKEQGNEFPAIEYAQNPKLTFRVEFVSDRSFRIKAASGYTANTEEASLMIVKDFSKTPAWNYSRVPGGHQYTGKYGSVTIRESPWSVEIRKPDGELLTKTFSPVDGKTSFTPVLPFSFIRRAADYSRSFNAALTISDEEKFYGTGESFTALNKRGQRVVLWTHDPNGVETESMYKPIPFYMSNKGYGVFIHTSAPVTLDFGATYNSSNSMLIGDENLDLFFFLGEPKEILNEYTELTGKPTMPPLWSFGLWMSRITYFSEEDGRNVARLLRKNRIPSDVIHFDTGWFETDWRCDYEFSASRFKDPKGMIADLKKEGFKTCLWQLPYFVPKNRLFPEITKNSLAVKNANQSLPYEDAVLDFTNPQTIEWYRGKIGGLLKLGVSAIKVDFGEAAPLSGVYANGKTGFYEHNLYPLRYNKIVSELTKEITGEQVIWARSTWAGSQRYPLHWGGDAETTFMGMESQLRGGLSLGLSGFTFWSHDVGGFTAKTPENLYRRWLPFGILASHTRTHGQAPKEPWEYGEDFQNYFRKVVELKYHLMPYIYVQAKESAEKGLPMVRALLLEFPHDPGAWLVDNQYMYGSDILVAPLFNPNSQKRNVYLPPGNWVDYQTRKTYTGGWHEIEAGSIEIIMLVREGIVLPTVKVAQNTNEIDWKNIELESFVKAGLKQARVKICLPSDGVLREIPLVRKGNGFEAQVPVPFLMTTSSR